MSAPLPNLDVDINLSYWFISDGVTYTISIVDERPDMELDPTLNVFRGDEEEPIVTLHLNPVCPCYEKDHIIAREKEQEPDEPERDEDEEPGPWNELR